MSRNDSDILLTPGFTGHSAEVEIELFMAGQRFSVGQIGRGLLIFDHPVSLPSRDGELVLTVDGRRQRWAIVTHQNGDAARVIHADFTTLE